MKKINFLTIAGLILSVNSFSFCAEKPAKHNAFITTACRIATIEMPDSSLIKATQCFRRTDADSIPCINPHVLDHPTTNQGSAASLTQAAKRLRRTNIDSIPCTNPNVLKHPTPAAIAADEIHPKTRPDRRLSPTPSIQDEIL